MRKQTKIKIFLILIGLFLPLSIIRGAGSGATNPLEEMKPFASTEETHLELIQILSSRHAQSLRENLDLFKARQQNLESRKNAIGALLNQFRQWLGIVTLESWSPGYEIILEDISAYPDSAEKSGQLRTFAELAALIRENEVSAETIAQIELLLNQRKRTAMEAKVTLVVTKCEELKMGYELAGQLITQVQEAHDEDVARLNSLEISEAHSALVFSVSAAIADNSVAAEEVHVLRPVVDLVHEWVELQEQIKREEISHIETNLTLLKRKFSRLKTSQTEISVKLKDLAVKEASLETEGEIKKSSEALQGFSRSIPEIMRNINDLFDREVDRLLSLNPYAAIRSLEN